MYLLQNIEKMSHLLLPSPWKFLTTEESREHGRGGLLEGSGGNLSQKNWKSSCSATPVVLRGKFLSKMLTKFECHFYAYLKWRTSTGFYFIVCAFFLKFSGSVSFKYTLLGVVVYM